MKTLIIFSIIFSTTCAYAQEWKKYHRRELGLNYLSLVSSDLDNGRHFRINPYDNSLWMGRNFLINTISSDGSASYYYSQNTSIFKSHYSWVTFEFLPDRVIALERNNGIFTFKDGVWSNPYVTNRNTDMKVEHDTVYMLRDDQFIGKWAEGYGGVLGFKEFGDQRFEVKNNLFWFSDRIGDNNYIYVKDKQGNYVHISRTKMMDNANYDFKFSPHKDTLYVAGNKGLSMLHNFAFFDSIAPDNTQNMPTGIILDFEFDANDNIWALFGTNPNNAYAIAHYDQQSKTWDKYYDANNSNLYFNAYSSIEMDNLGNLWMVNTSYIHVLELGTLPIWLSTKTLETKTGVELFPNPVVDEFQIEAEHKIKVIQVVNQLGQTIKNFDNKLTKYNVSDLPSGIYFVEILFENDEKGNVKMMKK